MKFRLALIALLALPAADAAAAETAGRGENITHVRNIPYPEVHDPEESNAGSDVEFATMTFQQPQAGTPRACTKAKKAKGKRRKAKLRKRCRAARAKTVAVERTFAFAGSYGDGMQIVDITNPEDAKLAATYDCGIAQGDVQLFKRDDLGGRWFATFTADDGYDIQEDSQCIKDARAMGFNPDPLYGGTFIADVTDPYAPKTVTFIEYERGSHNQSVHPSGRYLYNSNADLITSVLPAVEITDISDVANPKPVGEFPLLTLPGLGTESHDITWNADGTRAYVAALSHGEILDTSDPAKPHRVGTLIHPAINVWHEMRPITVGGKDFIIAEDEFVGALETGQCPNGGVHVFDATGPREEAPVPVGYWNIPDAGLTEDGLGRCTAHVFQLHPEQGLMTIAYYNGGVRVVDLRGLEGVSIGDQGSGMRQLGYFRFPDSNAWSVKAPTASREGFYLYANDHRRGFDVFRYAPGAAPARRGRWLDPSKWQAADAGELLALCLLKRGSRG